MQKFSQFYVTYWNIVQFNHDLGKLDYFEKSVLKLMAGPVVYWLFLEEQEQFPFYLAVKSLADVKI